MSAAQTTFWYSAVTSAGKKAAGLRSARDRDALADALRERDLLLVRAWRLPVPLGGLGDDAASGRMPVKDEAAMNRQLEVLLDRGVPLVEALEVAEGVVSKASAPRVAKMREAVAGGAGFAEAARRSEGFDAVAIGVYRAAERTGDLAPAAGRLADAAERRLKVRAKAITVMIYPSVVATVSLGLLFGMLVFLVPQLAESVRDIGDGASVPAFSEFVFGIGEWLRANLLAFFVFLGAVAAGVFAARGLVVRGLASIGRAIGPIRSLLRSIELARFFSVLAAMTKSGVPLADALSSASMTIGDPKLRTQLDRLQRELVEGGVLRVLIDRVSELPASTRKLLVAAERSGDLDQAFDALATHASAEVETRSERLTALMEPVVILAMFAVIAPIIVAIALPMLNLRTGA
jgi:general secretion pathway protein F